MLTSIPFNSPESIKRYLSSFQALKRKVNIAQGILKLSQYEYAGNRFMCKYDVQIDNESVYHVAGRIIGPRGANMKSIVEASSQGFHPTINPYEIVKIKLRGKGSGFREGPGGRESD